MLKLALRIYLTANVILAFLLALEIYDDFSDALPIFFVAFLCSMVFSLPAIPVLYFSFAIADRFRLNFWSSWLLLAIGVALTVAIIHTVIAISFREHIDIELLLSIMGIGYGASLLNVLSVNRFFHSIHQEDDDTDAFTSNDSL